MTLMCRPSTVIVSGRPCTDKPEVLLEAVLEHLWRDVAAGVFAVHGEGAVVGALHVAEELNGGLKEHNLHKTATFLDCKLFMRVDSEFDHF